MKICPFCNTEFPTQQSSCPSDGARLVEIRTWEPGALIGGKYRILAMLGRGGMGVVYKAEHIALEEVRALKVMSSALCEDSTFVKRFRREAQAARRLHHPNAVHVDDLDQAEDGSLFIVMDYVDGVTLGRLLDSTKSPLPVERALAIARGVAEGLAAAHAVGMVHRDIKPENIILARDPQGRDLPRILDFGIVAMREGPSTVITRRPLLTPDYAAPEQWRGTPAAELDGRTDLYGLGGVLYEMLTGQTPYHAHNYEGWMYQHLMEQPRPPSALHPELARIPGLDTLVLRLLEKKREDRPASAQAFLEELNLVEARRAAPLPVAKKPPSNAEAPEDAAAQNRLGLKYRDGDGVEQDYAEAARWFRKAAELGDADGQVNLGWMYEMGWGVTQNDAEAARLFRKAAEQGNADGRVNLGLMYEEGLGVAQNHAEAVRWYSMAAEQGDMGGQYNLGQAYFDGIGVSQDYTEAVRWFRKAAEQGNAEAQLRLGRMYDFGEGVAQNLTEAVRWYRKAAEQGHARAQANLGFMVDTGQGVARNDAEAVRWYRMAAEQGDPWGQYNAAVKYERGKGVKLDLSAALFWFERAAEQGLEPDGKESAADAARRLKKKGVIPRKPEDPTPSAVRGLT
ncbi:MAG: serine/threonine-protein kinase [Terracidiphilus sp.]